MNYFKGEYYVISRPYYTVVQGAVCLLFAPVRYAPNMYAAVGVKKFRVNPARCELNGVLIQSGNSNPKRAEPEGTGPPSVNRFLRPPP